MTFPKTTRRSPLSRLLLPALLAGATLGAAGCSDNGGGGNVPAASGAAEDVLLKHYLAEQRITNAQRLPSGLYVVPDSVNATRPLLAKGQPVAVLYTGRRLDGTVFDATSQHGNEPFRFVLGEGQVIPGWDLGLAHLHRGDKARLLIPSALAYGATGAGEAIPPSTPLVFTIQVLDAE